MRAHSAGASPKGVEHPTTFASSVAFEQALNKGARDQGCKGDDTVRAYKVSTSILTVNKQFFLTLYSLLLPNKIQIFYSSSPVCIISEKWTNCIVYSCIQPWRDRIYIVPEGYVSTVL